MYIHVYMLKNYLCIVFLETETSNLFARHPCGCHCVQCSHEDLWRSRGAGPVSWLGFGSTLSLIDG